MLSYFLIPVFLLALVFAAPASAADKPAVLEPDPPSVLNTPAVELSAEEREALLARKRQLEKGVAEPPQNNPPSPAGSPPVKR